MRVLALSLLTCAAARLRIPVSNGRHLLEEDASFEWVGIFDVSADNSHTWIAQKATAADDDAGTLDYADPTMKLVLIATSATTEAAMEAVESDASTLMDGTCTSVVSGDTMTPTSAGVCYKLTFDSTASTSTYAINTTGLTGLVFAGEHVPTEFEYDTHYLQDSSSADVEPIAEHSPDTRYAYFDCSAGDASLVSYGEECMDEACTDCEVGAVDVSGPACYIAGTYVHWASCDATGSLVTVSIYEDCDLTCDDAQPSTTADQIHYENVSLGCFTEEHEHGGAESTVCDRDDDITISGSVMTGASLAGSVIMAAALLLMGN